MDILCELNQKKYIEDLQITYDIRFCSIHEADQLVEFIKKYWKSDHIFVKCRKLLDWQHLNYNKEQYNFVIAKHRLTQEIHSILGFVPTQQFDNKIQDVEVWPCIWKSRDDVKVKGLGVALYYFLKENINIQTISILGISEVALSIYKHWNFVTGNIKQYYILNDECKLFNIAVVDGYSLTPQKYVNNDNRKIANCNIAEFMNISEPLKQKISKYKSIDYYVNRFYGHPIYVYKMYKIFKDDETKAIIFARECYARNATVLRIVDYIGDISELIGCGQELQRIMIENKYEYIDFVIVGSDSDSLNIAGFKLRDDSVIIPNYFEPFLQENIDLDYAFKTVDNSAIPLFYKADADQDRPNIL